jgi:3-phenylpropionate/trans-cinnamate dioxygenase ferredoxin subunit
VTATRHDVGAVAEFPEDALTPVVVDGQEIVVVRQNGRVYAMPDRCTHAKYPLQDGELLDGKIRCVHHGATFDLATGRPTMPAVKKLQLFDAQIEDGRVVVTLQQV